MFLPPSDCEMLRRGACSGHEGLANVCVWFTHIVGNGCELVADRVGHLASVAADAGRAGELTLLRAAADVLGQHSPGVHLWLLPNDVHMGVLGAQRAGGRAVSDYIDRAVGDIWIIFGEHGDGCVDLSNGNDDIFTHITREQAEKLITLRDKFLNDVRAIYETMPNQGRDQ